MENKENVEKIILAIDDSVEILMGLEAILGDRYDLRLAKSVAMGLKALRVVKPSLILLDIEMPEMSGFEFLEYLKEQSEYKDTPTVFISSNSDQKTIEKALEMGAADYIIKPFVTDILREKVKTLLNRKI